MIPIWAISAIGSALVAGAAGYGLASKLGDAKLARAEAGWAQERAVAATKHAETVEAYRKKDAEREAIKTASIEEAHAQIDKLQMSLQRANAASVGVRSQFAAFIADSTRAAESANAEQRSAISRATTGVLQDVFGRLDGFAQSVATFADAERIAHTACVREHPVN